MKPITLTYEKVLKAARKAYKEKRLGFQNRKKRCMYFYPGNKDVRCAIGAALPERFKNDPDFPNGSGIALMDDYIRTSTSSLYKMEELQMAHDAICDAKGKKRERYLSNFKDLLGV